MMSYSYTHLHVYYITGKKFCKYVKAIDIHYKVCYNNIRKAGETLMKGSEDMDKEMATATEQLLRAILELIDKCETLEELREAVKRILGQ